MITEIVKCANEKINDCIVPGRRYNNTGDIPPIGDKLCFWCGKDRPKIRRKYCSDECQESAQIMFDPQSYIGLSFILQKQSNCCIGCGLDYSDLIDEIKSGLNRRNIKAEHFQIGARINQCIGGDSWLIQKDFTYLPRLEVHHITPVHLGGSCYGVENVEVLCVHCHKLKHSKRN